MTPQDFIAKWKRANLSERSACHQHFLDLCDLLGQPKPADADPDGDFYTFERGVTKTEGGHGWADVWMRNHFGWEYKAKHRNLDAAYAQLCRYREDLENPPLLVVCDLDRFRVHTNFTNTAKRVYEFSLAELDKPDNLATLRHLFTNPEALRPGLTPESITEQTAESFGQLADGLRLRGVPAPRAAHFLMKLMFCMFGEDVSLLPDKLFGKVLRGARNDPRRLHDQLRNLFQTMAGGGYFGADEIPWFNGGLFADAEAVELTTEEIRTLVDVNAYDWANVEPSIFGTLFERTLDPEKRARSAAHYTSKHDILTLLEPVLMAPLRDKWVQVKADCEALWAKVQMAARKTASGGRRRSVTPKQSAAGKKLEQTLRDFSEHLAHIRILDPACGSGNFLYLAIKLLLDLNKEVISYAAQRSVSMYPTVRPTQLAGLEINPYAQELASVVIWIGYLQWMHDNGFSPHMQPVLEPIESIKLMDAIVDLSDPEHPREPAWPKADFIVGNPPFLGGKLLRTNLGDAYVDAMFAVWDGRVPREADLCCYWFEKGRDAVKRRRCDRAGLLATQGIRGGANRKVLERIKESGDIFFAVSDREWVLDGAAVHVSMVGFDGGNERSRTLDGEAVPHINPNLRSAADTTTAKRLAANVGISFMGDTKVGPFDIRDEAAVIMLIGAVNPHGLPSSDVIWPWFNGIDLTRRARRMWIVDFGVSTSERNAALYEQAFEYVRQNVKAFRANARSGDRTGVPWWRHQRPRPEMRAAIAPHPRFIATPTVSKHRLFEWITYPAIPDHQLIVFGRADDYFFGVLHSRLHELWARCQGTQLREVESGFRYTPTSCFETFPFPEPTEDQTSAIASAARRLDRLRTHWLNPPEWTREEVLEFSGAVDGPWARFVHDPDAHGIGTVRYPRMVAKDEQCARQLARRTLTNLYNERPTWLDLAHRELDEAVFAAYGWDPDLADDDILARLLALNHAREPAGAARR